LAGFAKKILPGLSEKIPGASTSLIPRMQQPGGVIGAKNRDPHMDENYLIHIRKPVLK
jgi:hypothetical protein